MKFGLVLAGQYFRDAPADLRVVEMLEQVRLARDLGFDSVWMVHHYLIDFLAFQPIPMLGRVAAEAGEMAIGTAIYVLPLQHPVEVAENFATLDALSGGGLIFGVAQGYREEEFRAMGIPRKERAGRFEEAVALVSRLWTEDAVDFRGRYYQVERATLAMKPVQKPRPPIWIGATVEAGIARAAGLGDAWMIGPGVEFPKLRHQLDLYRDALRELGKLPARSWWPRPTPRRAAPPGSTSTRSIRLTSSGATSRRRSRTSSETPSLLGTRPRAAAPSCATGTSWGSPISSPGSSGPAPRRPSPWRASVCSARRSCRPFRMGAGP